MNTLEKILDLISLNYASDKAFEDALGIPNKTVYDWKRKRSESYFKKIPEIANLFGVSIESLFVDKKIIMPPPGETINEISAEDIQKLEKIKNLPPDKQKIIEILLNDG